MPDQPSLFDAPPLGAPAPQGGDANSADAAPRERLYLADAFALAYRAYHSFRDRPLYGPDGLNTSAVYGFATSVLKLLEDEKPEHIAVVFDKIGGRGTFRDELYGDYKANRPPMPDGVKAAIPYIKRLVEALDIPCVEVEGFEADDVIGTLARRAEGEGVDVVIFSPDKDFRQLLSPCVSMLRPPYMGETFEKETPETFRERFDGLDPAQFVDLLALEGDAVDNVPGVPGIGRKTAIRLVQDYGTVENLLEHAEEVAGKKAREGLAAHRDDALLSKRLVTIDTAVPLDLDWHRLRLTAPDMEAVHALFNELEFGSRLRSRVEAYARGEAPRSRRLTTLPDDDPDLAFDFGPYEPVQAMDHSDVAYTTVLSREDLPAAVTHVEGHGVVSFDTETSALDPLVASLVGVSLAAEEKKAAYVPTPMPDGTPAEAVLDGLRPVLEDPSTLKVGHNVKYDLLVLHNHGLAVRGPLFDTMVAHYLVDPEASHKLDDVSSFHLNYRPQPITELIGTGKNALSMRDVPIEQVGPYACEDADVALRLYPVLKERLEKDGLTAIAEEIEFPLVYVLADMERTGVKVSREILGEIRVGLEAEIAEMERQVHEVAGRVFAIASTKQLTEVLFGPPGEGGLGLKPIEKTGKGAASTNERVLAELSTEHPLPALVLDWRKLTKLKSTYVDALPALINPTTGRVHTDFNQTVAATGRLSSSNPNLQNIPIRTERGREVRKAFVAEPGNVLLAADYAQIELRIIAHMSRDPGLVEAFRSGLDIHTATAARVYSIAPSEVTRGQRDRVKQVNYGIPYGISAFGLAQRMRIPIKDAQVLIDQYRASYPDVLTFLDTLVEEARRRGYVETLLGRRRYVPQIIARNPRDRAYAERIALNMPIQGTQADMIKKAMVAIHRRLADEGLAAKMILQVHDELVFEVPEAEVEAVTAIVKEEMPRALPLDVPIEVEVGVGPNWLDAH